MLCIHCVSLLDATVGTVRCIVIINYLYFIVKAHSVLCILLSNDKFYIHFGGSLEY